MDFDYAGLVNQNEFDLDHQAPRPFDKCDRKKDFRGAWAFFERAEATGGLRGFS